MQRDLRPRRELDKEGWLVEVYASCVSASQTVVKLRAIAFSCGRVPADSVADLVVEEVRCVDVGRTWICHRSESVKIPYVLTSIDELKDDWRIGGDCVDGVGE